MRFVQHLISTSLHVIQVLSDETVFEWLSNSAMNQSELLVAIACNVI